MLLARIHSLIAHVLQDQTLVCITTRLLSQLPAQVSTKSAPILETTAKREFRNRPTSVNRNPELFRIIQALQDSPDESAEDDEEDEKEDTQFES